MSLIDDKQGQMHLSLGLTCMIKTVPGGGQILEFSGARRTLKIQDHRENTRRRRNLH